MGEGIRAVLETIFKGYEAAAIYFQNEGNPKIKKYFQGLLLLFILSFLPSLPLIYYGIFYDSSWALVIGGIWRAICILLLMLAAIPIGIIYEIATGGFAGSGKRYVRLVSGLFISELLFVLIVSIIPVSNNPAMFPIFSLAALLLGFLGAMNMNRKFVVIVVSVILFGIILSFYFPNTFHIMKITIKGVDLEVGKPTLLKYSLHDYKTGKVEFFYPNGEPKVWYVEVDGKIELQNKKGFHTSIGIDANPINKSILGKLKMAKWENLSPNNIIHEEPPATLQPVAPSVPDASQQQATVEQQKQSQPEPQPEPPKEPDHFVLKPTECRGGYGVSLNVLGGEINLQDGTIKVIFLQQTYEGVDYYAILSPAFNTYVTDNNGLRYKYLSMEGMASMDVPDKKGMFTKLVRDVPHRYTITFDANNRKPNTLHYTSTFFIPDALGMFFRQQTVSCSNIQVIPEFSSTR